MTDTPVKLCSTCAHGRPRVKYSFFGRRVEEWQFAHCGRTDLVSGDGTNGNYCSTERLPVSYDDSCGPSGKYWEGR